MKARNILLTTGGDVQLTDFGVSKVVTGGTLPSKRTLAQGSPWWMSPEVVLDKPATYKVSAFLSLATSCSAPQRTAAHRSAPQRTAAHRSAAAQNSADGRGQRADGIWQRTTDVRPSYSPCFMHVWCGVVSCGLVRCGAVRCGAVRCVVLCDFAV